jgi:hypothetical protein
MDLVDQGFLSAKPVKKKDINMVKLKEALKKFIKRHYALPIIKRGVDV